jgi:hypothetical protein
MNRATSARNGNQAQPIQLVEEQQATGADELSGTPRQSSTQPGIYSTSLIQEWSPADITAACALAGVGLFTNISTVLNNAYSIGSTLYDSAIFQTIIWRSGWALKPAPVVDDVSFLNVHFSLINYIPNLLSYLVPIDRMSYYGLVYGSVYAGLIFIAFVLYRGIFKGHSVLAAIAAVAFYLSGEVLSGQWEPRQEIASALFTAMFFLGWATERRSLAVVSLILNAAVREDCGLLLALPLCLLVAHEWVTKKRGYASLAPPYTLHYASASTLLSVASFSTQKIFFHERDTITTFYYGVEPFAHLTLSLISLRIEHIVEHAQFLWMPGIVLIVAAIVLRDIRIAIGWLAFIPYWVFNLLSREDISAYLASYKSFPFILALLWPAVIALRSPVAQEAKLRWVQVAVLLAALVMFEDGNIRFAAPDDMVSPYYRWQLHPETQNTEHYRAIEARLDPAELGDVRASSGVLALYPYSFPIWSQSSVSALGVDVSRKADSLLWFEGDFDKNIVEDWLTEGRFPYRYRVIGTKINLATRRDLETFRKLGPVLAPSH